MEHEPVPPQPQPAAPGARCGVHPERPALGVCRRCGNYMCQACSSSGRFVRCPACRTRDGIGSFPFSRDRWTFDGLVGHCFATWRDHAVTLGLATLIFFSAVFGLSLVGTFAQALLGGDELAGLVVMLVAQVVQTVVQVGMQIGVLSMCFEAVEGRPPDLGNLVVGFRKLPAALLQLVIFYFVAGGAVGLVIGVAWIASGDFFSTTALWIYGAGAVLLFAPAFYLGLGVAFAMFELARNPRATGLGAIATSWRVVRGHRWPVLGVGALSGIGSMVGMIACCVGMLITYPLAMMLMCALYLTLSNTNPPEPLATPVEAAPGPAGEPDAADEVRDA